MKFYVIYTVDTYPDYPDKHIRPYMPRNRKPWKTTETGRSELSEDRGKHRKLVAELTKRQFDAFVKDQELYVEDVETLGSLTEFGLLPAISFNGRHEDIYQNAYVTPLPEVCNWPEDKQFSERDWDRIRDAIIRNYSEQPWRHRLPEVGPFMLLHESLQRWLKDNRFVYGYYEDAPFMIIPGWKEVGLFLRAFNPGQVGDDPRQCDLCGAYADEEKDCIERPDFWRGGAMKKHGYWITAPQHMDMEQALTWALGDPDVYFPWPPTPKMISDSEAALEKAYAIYNGQELLPGEAWEWPLPWTEKAAEILVKYADEVEAEHEGEALTWQQGMDLLCEKIKDDLDTGEDNSGLVGYGFSDEYVLCGKCHYTVLRTSPDSYGWTPDYFKSDWGDYLCEDCANPDDIVAQIQQRIDDGKQPSGIPEFFERGEEWIEVQNPDGYDGRWENGYCGGQKDDPLRQGQRIRQVKNDDGESHFQVLYDVLPGQFDVAWRLYIRQTPGVALPYRGSIDGDDPRDGALILESWAEDLGYILSGSDIKLPHDPAHLLEIALKKATGAISAGRNYVETGMDAESGEIHVVSGLATFNEDGKLVMLDPKEE